MLNLDNKKFIAVENTAMVRSAAKPNFITISKVK